VLALSVADQPQLVRDCVAVAGDWLAVGLDPRPDRLAAFPWRGGPGAAPTLESLIGRLVDLGVRRFVLSHGGARPDPALLTTIVRSFDADVLVAGGATSLDDIRALRDSGIQGLILGEPLLTGAIDYSAALEAAA
jgi:phosphoribosylformimino-5-aminoimidazole carboxamide ribotide isomerase